MKARPIFICSECGKEFEMPCPFSKYSYRLKNKGDKKHIACSYKCYNTYLTNEEKYKETHYSYRSKYGEAIY